MIKVIENGFFNKLKNVTDDPTNYTFKDRGKGFWEQLESPQPYNGQITRQTLENITEEFTTTRHPLFITGEAGRRVFNEALQNYVRDEVEGITREQFEAAYPINIDSLDFEAPPFITGTSGYVVGYDPDTDLSPNMDNEGEYRIVIQSLRRNNIQTFRRLYEHTGYMEELPDSMTTVREFRTEQEAIQYLDNISND